MMIVHETDDDWARRALSGPRFFREIDVAVANFSIADETPTRHLGFDNNVETIEFDISDHDPAFPNGRKLESQVTSVSARKRNQKHWGNLSPAELAGAVARFYAIELHEDLRAQNRQTIACFILA
jgi:hypothetical protein